MRSDPPPDPPPDPTPDPTRGPAGEPPPRHASEFVRGPKWRTRTTPARRHRLASVTFGIVVATGTAVVAVSIWLLERLDAPAWVSTAPWWLPTAGAVAWTLVHPRVSGLSDDDDDSWFGYSIRWVLVGELEPRPAPVRVLAAAVFGAPVVWATVVAGVLTLVGIV